MKINYFNCGCQKHYGDYTLYLATKELFKKVGSELGREIVFVAKPENADLLLFGGGTVLGMFFWRQFYELDKPTAVFGSGWPGGTKTIQIEFQKLLKRCFLVGVRGKLTQKVLQNIGVNAKVIGDLAWSVTLPNESPNTHLAVGGVRQDTLGTGLFYFKKIYTFLRDEGWNIKLLRMSGNDRKEFFGFPVVTEQLSLEETLSMIARSNLVVGQRLHMALYGLVAGRKTIGYEYVWNKMEDSLSVLNYPYYLKNPSVQRFKELYHQLMNDSHIMDDVKDKIAHYKQIQKEFAKQILKKAVTL